MAAYNKNPDLRIRFVYAVSLMLCLIRGHASASDWNYEPKGQKGPENWHLKYPECGSVVNSPIDVNTSEVVYDRTLQQFDYSDYGNIGNVHFKLKNVGGHTAEVLFSGTELFLKGGSLPSTYKLERVHFHWGLTKERGSEHLINGKSFPIEAHFVHRQKRFKSTAVAATHPFGLAVVAVLFKEGSKNEDYEQLLQHFDPIQNPDNEVDIPTFPINDLLPANNLYYYRYHGSLTTPPCYESVIWSILQEKVEMSIEQITRFHRLLNEHHQQLVDDFRPVQPLNSRTVTTNRNPEDGNGYKTVRNAEE